jgi:hypothetical protein
MAVARADSSSPATMILAIFRNMAILLAARTAFSMTEILRRPPAAGDRIPC